MEDQIIRVVTDTDLLFFVIKPLIYPESVVEAAMRMSDEFFASAGDLDIVLGLYRGGHIDLDRWRRVFAVGEKCRFSAGGKNEGLFKVWNIKVRYASVESYFEIHRPGTGAGILTIP